MFHGQFIASKRIEVRKEQALWLDLSTGVCAMWEAEVAGVQVCARVRVCVYVHVRA